MSVGAVPVFVDINEATYTIDADRAANAVGPRTRAIVPVHLYGRCADLGSLAALAEERGLRLIEDAAQAHGAEFDGRAAGTVGDLGCFSFYPSKNLGACGDAGAVVTRNRDLAARLRLLRNYGQTRKYQHDSLGSNSRLDELQAAVLRVKLPHLEAWNEARRRAAEAYAAALDPAMCRPATVSDRTHVFHLYAIRTARRNELQRYLTEHSVETQIHYPIPVHLQPAFRDIPHVRTDLRVTRSES